jgi:hypothetical protein
VGHECDSPKCENPVSLQAVLRDYSAGGDGEAGGLEVNSAGDTQAGLHREHLTALAAVPSQD